MAKIQFGDVIKEIKENIDRSTDNHQFFIAGEHMESENIHLVKRGRFADSDVGPAFIRLFKPGQILYGSRRTYLKKVAVADFEGITSNTTFVLESKDEDVFRQNLLPFIMLSNSFTDYSIKKSKGSTNPYILFSDLVKYEFDLPSIGKQDELSNVLWAIEETCQSYKKLLAETDELVNAQFTEMFGDPISNDKGWRFARFPEVTRIVLGSTPRTNRPEYWDGDVKWVTPAELSDDSFYIDDTVKHITELGVKETGLKPFPAGTVIFSTRAPIGKTAIAACEMYCNQGFKNFVCGPDLKPIYLYYLLKSKKEYFIGLGSGTTFKELSRGAIEKISISVPPLVLQEQFENLFVQSVESKQALQQSLKEARALQKKIVEDNFIIQGKEDE